MFKAILTTIFVCVIMTGCLGKSEREKISEAKAMSICKDRGGLSSFKMVEVIGPMLNLATCNNGERLDYSNETGPSVAEALKEIENKVSISVSDKAREECANNKGLSKINISHTRVILVCKDNREIDLINLTLNIKEVNK